MSIVKRAMNEIMIRVFNAIIADADIIRCIKKNYDVFYDSVTYLDQLSTEKCVVEKSDRVFKR